MNQRHNICIKSLCLDCIEIPLLQTNLMATLLLNEMSGSNVQHKMLAVKRVFLLFCLQGFWMNTGV